MNQTVNEALNQAPGAQPAVPPHRLSLLPAAGAANLVVRPACDADVDRIAAILAESFPALYRAAFGKLTEARTTALLIRLFQARHLTLETTRVCEREGVIVGVLILHIGRGIGHGSAGAYGRMLFRTLGPFAALRAFGGGLSTNAILARRIPHAPDLAYIEALAVAASERGRGIGTRLLEDAARWSLAQSRPRLALHVLHANRGARRLYERMGFAPWPDFPTYIPRIQNLFTHRQPTWTAMRMLRILSDEAAACPGE